MSSTCLKKNKSDISISIVINKKKKRNTIPFKSVLGIDERRIYNWVRDESVTQCYQCENNFSFLIRKHHCRNCGKIFCKECSNYWIEIPNYINSVNKQNLYWSFNAYLEYFNLNENKERVCQECYSRIFELKELINAIKIFDLLQLNIEDYKVVALVSKTWYKIYKYYINFFKEIQYYLPDHTYSKKEIQIIDNNLSFFSGHSKWIRQMIVTTDWDNVTKEKEKFIFNIINSEKQHECSYLCCQKKCYDKLQPEDSIICFYRKINNYNIIKYLLEILNTSPIIELQSYLTNLVFSIRFYRKNIKIVSLFIDFLLKKAKESRNFCNILFWELTQLIKDVEFQIFYSNIRQKLVKSLDKETYTLFLNGYDFTQNIIEIINNSTDPKDAITKHLKSNTYYSINNFCLPINIDKKFKGIDLNNIKIINSKTKPIILPCIYTEKKENKTFGIMVKKEDTRKEAIIMNIIKLMDYFLKKDENLDLNITTYNILPISNEYGYIEFVNNSFTLYSIREEENFSIQNFIMEKNPKITAEQLRDNFTKSCAAYCVITYLLGIGDRHLDNIMITDKAYIFNIDFGYVLGKDPKLLAPEFRITGEMIDAMGGIKSKYYNDFKNYCFMAYNCLRNHTNTFFVMLSLLYNLKPPIDNLILNKNYVKSEIIKRFIPGEQYDEAAIHFKYKINNNSNTYSGNVIDYFHKKCKSGSSSVSNSNETILNSAVNAWNATSNLTLNIGNNLKNLFWK